MSFSNIAVTNTTFTSIAFPGGHCISLTATVCTITGCIFTAAPSTSPYTLLYYESSCRSLTIAGTVFSSYARKPSTLETAPKLYGAVMVLLDTPASSTSNAEPTGFEITNITISNSSSASTGGAISASLLPSTRFVFGERSSSMSLSNCTAVDITGAGFLHNGYGCGGALFLLLPSAFAAHASFKIDVQLFSGNVATRGNNIFVDGTNLSDRELFTFTPAANYPYLSDTVTAASLAGNEKQTEKDETLTAMSADYASCYKDGENIHYTSLLYFLYPAPPTVYVNGTAVTRATTEGEGGEGETGEQETEEGETEDEKKTINHPDPADTSTCGYPLFACFSLHHAITRAANGVVSVVANTVMNQPDNLLEVASTSLSISGATGKETVTVTNYGISTNVATSISSLTFHVQKLSSSSSLFVLTQQTLTFNTVTFDFSTGDAESATLDNPLMDITAGKLILTNTTITCSSESYSLHTSLISLRTGTNCDISNCTFTSAQLAVAEGETKNGTVISAQVGNGCTTVINTTTFTNCTVPSGCYGGACYFSLTQTGSVAMNGCTFKDCKLNSHGTALCFLLAVDCTGLFTFTDVNFTSSDKFDDIPPPTADAIPPPTASYVYVECDALNQSAPLSSFNLSLDSYRSPSDSPFCGKDRTTHAREIENLFTVWTFTGTEAVVSKNSGKTFQFCGTSTVPCSTIEAALEKFTNKPEKSILFNSDYPLSSKLQLNNVSFSSTEASKTTPSLTLSFPSSAVDSTQTNNYAPLYLIPSSSSSSSSSTPAITRASLSKLDVVYPMTLPTPWTALFYTSGTSLSFTTLSFTPSSAASSIDYALVMAESGTLALTSVTASSLSWRTNPLFTLTKDASLTCSNVSLLTASSSSSLSASFIQLEGSGSVSMTSVTLTGKKATSVGARTSSNGEEQNSQIQDNRNLQSEIPINADGSTLPAACICLSTSGNITFDSINCTDISSSAYHAAILISDPTSASYGEGERQLSLSHTPHHYHNTVQSNADTPSYGTITLNHLRLTNLSLSASSSSALSLSFSPSRVSTSISNIDASGITATSAVGSYLTLSSLSTPSTSLITFSSCTFSGSSTTTPSSSSSSNAPSSSLSPSHTHTHHHHHLSSAPSTVSSFCMWDSAMVSVTSTRVLFTSTSFTNSTTSGALHVGSNAAVSIRSSSFENNSPKATNYDSLRHNIICSSVYPSSTLPSSSSTSGVQSTASLSIQSLNSGDGKLANSSLWVLSDSTCALSGLPYSYISPYFVPLFSAAVITTNPSTQKPSVLCTGDMLFPCGVKLTLTITTEKSTAQLLSPFSSSLTSRYLHPLTHKHTHSNSKTTQHTLEITTASSSNQTHAYFDYPKSLLSDGHISEVTCALQFQITTLTSSPITQHHPISYSLSSTEGASASVSIPSSSSDSLILLQQTPKKSWLTFWVLLMIVVCGLALIVLIVGVIIICCCRKRYGKRSQTSDSETVVSNYKAIDMQKITDAHIHDDDTADDAHSEGAGEQQVVYDIPEPEPNPNEAHKESDNNNEGENNTTLPQTAASTQRPSSHTSATSQTPLIENTANEESNTDEKDDNTGDDRHSEENTPKEEEEPVNVAEDNSTPQASPFSSTQVLSLLNTTGTIDNPHQTAPSTYDVTTTLLTTPPVYTPNSLSTYCSDSTRSSRRPRTVQPTQAEIAAFVHRYHHRIKRTVLTLATDT